MHTFHIPVLGLSYTVDTPLKVARYGISSVVSIIEDELVEKMRLYHSLMNGIRATLISADEEDSRARRITGYLNLLGDLVERQFEAVKQQPFIQGSDIVKYFELLPASSELRILFDKMILMEDGEEKSGLQLILRERMTPGAIDVNIMAKVDNLKYAQDGKPMPVEYSDALSALRGYANSELSSSVVLSAGYNPRLYSYVEKFRDFFPDEQGKLKKKVILKVSDFRSALIQGKIMAKKGIWVSEFRIESGLNCGGHAFATDGFLLGPILEEFKQKRASLTEELYELCSAALAAKGYSPFPGRPPLRITVQGGIGTANEDEFLRTYYHVDGTGWGSPFLLVPEVTNVDDTTLAELATATQDDYYLSHASPLGVPFHNFRRSTSEEQRKERIRKGRPGSPCYKKFLSTDTEFTAQPICTASRQYQARKIGQLKQAQLAPGEYEAEVDKVMEKDCLCEGLSTSVYLKDGIPVSHGLSAVTICPGPNLAYFSGVHTLKDMTDHIYGRKNILNSLPRPHMFINELKLYVDYLKDEMSKYRREITAKQNAFFDTFRINLLNGISYYKELLPNFRKDTAEYMENVFKDLGIYQEILDTLRMYEAPVA